MERQAERLLPPDDRLGIERLADAGDEAQRERSCCARARSPAFISMRIAVGAVYQTVTCCSCEDAYQRSASNSASSTMLVTPLVSGAMMP